MLKKEQLFYLIKSMSKAEKRYFKLFASSNNDSSNYFLLFDAIDKQEIYSEEKIKRAFAGKKFIRQLHVTKNYLNNLILKSLRSYHSSISKDAELKDMLRNIELLIKRELFQQAEGLIEKACRLAERYEKWPDLLQLLDIKRRLALSTKSSTNAAQMLQEISNREKDVLSKIEHISGYWALSAKQFPFLEKPLDFTKNRLISDAGCADSLQAKTLYNYIWQSIYFSRNQFDLALQKLQELIDQWETNEHQIIEHPGSYLTILNNLVGICLQQKHYKLAEETLYKIRLMVKKYQLKANNPVAVKAMLHSFNVELEMLRDTGRVKQGIAMVPEIICWLEQGSLTILPSYRLMLYYQIAYFYFSDAQYNEALKYINLIFAFNFGATREDIQAYAHLLFLIIHFELRNFTLLKYAVESCRRFLKKKRELHPYEKALLKHFSRLSTTPLSEHKNIFKRLKKELFEDINDRQRESILDYLDFDTWIEKNV